MKTMPEAPKCEVICQSLSRHLTPLHTGLHLLRRAGRIRLVQRCVPPPAALSHAIRSLEISEASLDIRVNDRWLLRYDMHDSAEVPAANVEGCDVYFKRSCRLADLNLPDNLRYRVRPLGLYFPVLPDQACRLALARALVLSRSWRKRLGEIAAAAGIRCRQSAIPRLGDVERLPNPAWEEGILFFARAWNPQDFADSRRAEILSLNEFRAGCVRELRARLGSAFSGGLADDAFALRQYPDAVIANPSGARQQAYLARMTHCRAGVATRGLHDSIGAKLAEYVASARAWISEPLTHDLPSLLEPGRHYLPFSTPAEAAAQGHRLLSDPALAKMMMTENWSYYRTWSAPDVQLWRTLLHVL
jgi:hypothetical protein